MNPVPKPAPDARQKRQATLRTARRQARIARARVRQAEYGGSDWQAAKAAALARDRYRCVWCGTRDGLTVAHLRERVGMGGRRISVNQLENLCVLCQTCHSQQEERKITVEQIEAKLRG